MFFLVAFRRSYFRSSDLFPLVLSFNKLIDSNFPKLHLSKLMMQKDKRSPFVILYRKQTLGIKLLTLMLMAQFFGQSLKMLSGILTL
jgi:hypothetical protein